MTDEVADLVLRDNYEQNVALANAAANAARPAARARGLDEAARAATACSTGSSRRCRPPGRYAAGSSRGGCSASPSCRCCWPRPRSCSPTSCSPPTCPTTRSCAPTCSPTSRRRCGRATAPRWSDHPLRREIIVTQVVNDLVNGAGMTYWPRLAGETGATAAELIRANFVAREIFGSLELREELASYDNKLPAAVQTRMRIEMRTLVERASRWLVSNRRPPLDSEATVDFFGVTARKVMAELPTLMTGRELDAFEERRDALVGAVGARGPGRPGRGAAAGVHDARHRRDRRPRRDRPARGGPGALRARRAARACRCWSPGSSRCRATTAGRRWPAPRCATTCTPCTPSSPPRCWPPRPPTTRPRCGSPTGRRTTRSSSPGPSTTLEEICADDEADLARMSVGLRVVRGLLSTG